MRGYVDADDVAFGVTSICLRVVACEQLGPAAVIGAVAHTMAESPSAAEGAHGGELPTERVLKGAGG